MIRTSIGSDVEDALKSVVEKTLAGHAINRFTIQSGEDAGGDEAIFVDLYYNKNEKEFDPELNHTVRSAARAELFRLGEQRFPYIRHHLPAGQRIKQ